MTVTAEGADPITAFVEVVKLTGKALTREKGRVAPLREAAWQAIAREYEPIRSIEQLDRIEDPVKRFMAYSMVAATAWSHNERMVRLRAERSAAINNLHRRGYTPAQIQKAGHILEKRVVTGAINSADIREVPRMSEKRALESLRTSHATYVALERFGNEARERRRVLAEELMAGRYTEDGRRIPDEEYARGVRGYCWSNGELARMAGVSSALMSIDRRKGVPKSAPATRRRRRG